MSLLGEPAREGVIMPGPASIACVRNILESLEVGKEEDDLFPPPMFLLDEETSRGE